MGGDEHNPFPADKLVSGLSESSRQTTSFGSWGRLVASYWHHRNDANLLWLHYEDLVRDFEQCLDKIVNFAEFQLSSNERNTVAHFCSFEYMRKHKEKFIGTEIIQLFSEMVRMDYREPKFGMVRPDGGQIGQGHANLDEKLRAFVENDWNDYVKPATGCDSYAELYAKGTILN